jgi:hypothetical protein
MIVVVPKATCPTCRVRGETGPGSTVFEIRGRLENWPVRKCVACGNGFTVRPGLAGPRGKAIPPELWVRMEQSWSRQFDVPNPSAGATDDDLDTAVPQDEAEAVAEDEDEVTDEDMDAWRDQTRHRMRDALDEIGVPYRMVGNVATLDRPLEDVQAVAWARWIEILASVGPVQPDDAAFYHRANARFAFPCFFAAASGVDGELFTAVFARFSVPDEPIPVSALAAILQDMLTSVYIAARNYPTLKVEYG